MAVANHEDAAVVEFVESLQRPFQAAYLEKKIVCSLCYNQKKEIKFFLDGSGIEHHFKVVHKEKCSPEVLLQCTRMTRKMHGNETRETIKLYMAEKFKKVKVYAISVRKSQDDLQWAGRAK